MEFLCSDELTHIGARALKVLARTSRQLRSTALIAMSGGVSIERLKDDASLGSLESDMIHLRRCCEAGFLLKGLTLSSRVKSITSLKPLERLPSHKLETLSCRWMRNVTSLEPLRDLRCLTTLDCSFMSSATSLEPLRDLRCSTTLDCSFMPSVTSLEPLRDLHSLTTLNCSEMDRVTNVEPLRDLHSLTTLNCSGMRDVTSLEPLRDLQLDAKSDEPGTSARPANSYERDCSSMPSVTNLDPLRDLQALQSRPTAGQLGASGSVTTLSCD